MLAVALGGFALQSPLANVVVVEGPREVLIEHLRHRRIDMFIGRLPDTDGLLETSIARPCSLTELLRWRHRVTLWHAERV